MPLTESECLLLLPLPGGSAAGGEGDEYEEEGNADRAEGDVAAVADEEGVSGAAEEHGLSRSDSAVTSALYWESLLKDR